MMLCYLIIGIQPFTYINCSVIIVLVYITKPRLAKGNATFRIKSIKNLSHYKKEEIAI